MFLTMVLAALAIEGLFGAVGLIPQTRPTRADVYGELALSSKLFANLLALVVFVTLFWLTMRRRTSGQSPKPGSVQHATG